MTHFNGLKILVPLSILAMGVGEWLLIAHKPGIGAPIMAAGIGMAAAIASRLHKYNPAERAAPLGGADAQTVIGLMIPLLLYMPLLTQVSKGSLPTGLQNYNDVFQQFNTFLYGPWGGLLGIVLMLLVQRVAVTFRISPEAQAEIKRDLDQKRADECRQKGLPDEAENRHRRPPLGPQLRRQVFSLNWVIFVLGITILDNLMTDDVMLVLLPACLILQTMFVFQLHPKGSRWRSLILAILIGLVVSTTIDAGLQMLLKP